MDIRKYNEDDIIDAEELKGKNTIGTQINAARRKMHLTSSDLAERLDACNINISPNAVRKWEVGVSLPTGISFRPDVQDPAHPAPCRHLQMQNQGMTRMN